MSESKILSVVGARPQFVKMAMINRELAHQRNIKHIVVHTGQHFDWNMSGIFLRELDIQAPDYNLQINSLSHSAMVGRMLEAVEGVLLRESPDIVLVYGDTNSTLAGALAARSLGIRTAHVEAGLRSHNMDMPEELNRVLTDRVSETLFCPTELSVANLRQEGFENLPCRIVKCGDVMYDASLHYRSVSGLRSRIIERLGIGEFLVCTVHRAENTDDPRRLANIVQGLNRLASEVAVVMSVHPRTRKAISDYGITVEFATIEPVGFFDMIELLKHCNLVVTDSGGLQKEAYFFGKGCLTLRDETEWMELVDRGCNILTGADAERIYDSYRVIRQSSPCFDDSIYGDGNARRRIVEELRRDLSG